MSKSSKKALVTTESQKELIHKQSERVIPNPLIMSRSPEPVLDMILSPTSRGNSNNGNSFDIRPSTVSNIGLYSKKSVVSTHTKHTLRTDRSLTIDELSKVHESMSISNYLEPTDEQAPYRPKRAKKMTRQELKRRH